MSQVHLVYSTNSDTLDRDIVCNATDGSTYKIFNTSNIMNESLVKQSSDYKYSENTYDEDKLIFLMIGGKQASVLSVTNQMARKNFSTDEQARVWASYAKEFSATKANVPSEETRKLAEERQQKRIEAEAQNPELAHESILSSQPKEPPAEPPKPKKQSQKKMKKTLKNGNEANGPH